MQMTGFGEKEIDIFFVICFKLKNQNDREVEMEYSELKSMIHIKNRSDERIHKAVEYVLNNLMKLRLRHEYDDEITLVNVFSKATIKKNEGVFSFKISEDFSYILNDFLKNYTLFDLEEMVQLKSGYSKKIYRLLKQFRSTGWYETNFEEFRFIMEAPESYDANKISEKILKPALKELSKFFPNLKLEKIKKGTKIVRLKFIWETEKVKVIEKPKTEKPMDELELKIQKRLFEKIAHKEKEKEQERSGEIWL